MMLYAHTPNPQTTWHLLAEHLDAVEALAAEFASAFGAEALARWVGRWHDIGKASEEFQAYLAACAQEPGRRFPTVDHKGAGMLAALEGADTLAFLISGHHGGLPSKRTLGTHLKELHDAGSRRGRLARTARARAAEAGLIPASEPAALAFPDFVMDERSLEFFLRMLFSALVDADHLDTEAHWYPEKRAARETTVDLSVLDARLQEAQAALSGRRDDPVNAVRHEVYEACVKAAEQSPGFFRLTVPTGGGKTRSGLAFALRHAVRHGLRRVIVVSPYLTITDQTADVFRDVLKDGRVVLEHHSDAGRHDDPDGEPTPEMIWRRLAAQNWDAPVVVTTAVQFFESLFGRRPMACRKLHRIAKSVVILDEAQTLPPKLLTPILDVLSELTAHYGVTVVICTATQPAFAKAPGFRDVSGVREIAPDPPRLFRALKRVRYEWPTGERWEWPTVAAVMHGEQQALAIVNTRADALALLDALDDPTALHLSTFLCAAHRRDVLAEVRGRLARQESCRVVSTQVVEAGVDIDFPMVLRAVGPLDRIVQAAGRCNREGKAEEGRVVVFEPAEHRLPSGAYKTGADVTAAMLRAGRVDADDPATFEHYFGQLFGSVATDAKQIQQLRAGLDYEAVADAFQMIEDETVSVLVRYQGVPRPSEDEAVIDHAERVEQLVREARGVRLAGRTPPRDFLARAQPYLVAVPRRQVDRLVAEGVLSPLVGELYLWEGRYDPLRGIGGMEGAALDAAALIA